MIARAPGKLVLSGAYAVLEGAPALVAAVDRYATVDTAREATFVTDEVARAIADGVLARAPWFDASPLRVATPEGGSRKLGLGSSAAVLVAAIGARLLEEGLPRLHACMKTFELALPVHRAAQGGGSGIDVAASCFGGLLVARLAPNGGLRADPHVDRPHDARFTVFAAQDAASTPSMLRAVRALAERSPDVHRGAMAEIHAGAQGAVAATSPSALADALARQYLALRALGEAAGVGIVPDEVAQLGELARREHASFGPSGAGGGDVAIFTGAASPSAAFVQAARGAGLEVLELALGAPGLHAVT